MSCDTLPALRAFIGLGEKGNVSLYPEKVPFTVFSFYSKNVKHRILFHQVVNGNVLLLYFVMVMFLEDELVPMDGCRSE